ncbi:hypothetical protein GGI23_005100 [Coemansia sp. RSA 2559]|nr:hypothetical protein GGI23_005100 [Coemansia sp. RSA 2559]
MTAQSSSDEQLEDSHGFFQFAALSDSEDEDGGLFNTTRDRTVAFDADKINFTPKIDEDRWYDFSDELSIGDWLSRHSGPEEITFTAQRMYFAKNYAKAALLCKQNVSEFLAKHKNKLRMATVREVLEIGAKSAIRIGDLESVRFFYDLYIQCGGKNPGYSYFLAEVLTALGRHEEALARHIEYLEERHQDASVWELVGKTLVALYSSNLAIDDGSIPDIWLRLALRAFYRSHKIIDACKNWKDMPVAVQRKRLQEDELLENAVSTLNLLRVQLDKSSDGDRFCDSDAVWDACIKESIVNESHLTMLLESCGGTRELRESAEWLVHHLVNDADDDLALDDDDKEEKNVTEL